MRRKAGIAPTHFGCVTHTCLLAAAILFITSHAKAADHNSTNMMGTQGLNLIPNARLDSVGTLRLTASRTGPYTHIVTGTQLTDRLYLGLRQTALSSSLTSSPEAFYPGIDAKLRLYQETALRPSIAIGLQGALGKNRLSAQYLTLSKRVNQFDITGGFGWGRFGTRNAIINPVLFHNTNRADWFQGPMGIFGGAEYHLTPTLALKADWTSDDWHTEESVKRAAPLSWGISYHPTEWLDSGLAWNAGTGLMARLSITPDMLKWPFKKSKQYNDIPLKNSNNKDDTITPVSSSGLSPLLTILNSTPQRIDAQLIVSENAPSTPADTGRAVRSLLNSSQVRPDFIGIHLEHHGLDGPDIILNSHDIEQAITHHRGSSEEIWQNTQIDTNIINTSSVTSKSSFKPLSAWHITLSNDTSLAERDAGLLGRSAALIGRHSQLTRHLFTDTALRFNIINNLDNLNTYRTLSANPIREDIDQFASHRVILEHSYLGINNSLTPALHLAGRLGYLEEMYAGLGGEILYRPFASAWAIGFETGFVHKRDPLTPWASGLYGDSIFTGHINGYYEAPDSNITLSGSIGRYLAGDVGTTLAATHNLDNGVALTATTTITNRADTDIINGGHTNVFAGLAISMPLGSLNVLPDATSLRVNAAPLGRRTAQKLALPSPLYAATEPLSYRHITRQWSQVMPHR